jgi:hypothetical protein
MNYENAQVMPLHDSIFYIRLLSFSTFFTGLSTLAFLLPRIKKRLQKTKTHYNAQKQYFHIASVARLSDFSQPLSSVTELILAKLLT